MAGYVYTNENCIGCNRCISVCPILTANQAVVVDGKPRIEVNHAQCINCGACFDACEHQAREYADDTEQFFADLQRGESISPLLAPAFLANYPREYEQILGGLRQMGAKPDHQCQLWRRHYDLGVYQLYYEESVYGRDLAAVSCGGQLHRGVCTGAASEADAGTQPDDVCGNLCEEVFTYHGQACVHQSVHCEEERDFRSGYRRLCFL